jgi:hypothetical protein
LYLSVTCGTSELCDFENPSTTRLQEKKKNKCSKGIEKKKNKCPKRILPSGRPLHTNAEDGGWMGKLVPRTGAGERVVLVHCAGTRQVAFGVGNAWSLFPTR